MDNRWQELRRFALKLTPEYEQIKDDILNLVALYLKTVNDRDYAIRREARRSDQLKSSKQSIIEERKLRIKANDRNADTIKSLQDRITRMQVEIEQLKKKLEAERLKKKYGSK